MSTQSTSPRNSTNELAKGGIVSRRDVLKGALVGAGALAAMAMPTPLMELLPGSAPKKALASNQNVADGIYAFRYFYDSGYSLDLPNSNPDPVNIGLYYSHNCPAAYFVVVYDSDCGGYRISPVCGHTPGMVLTATAGSGNDVRTAKDQALSTQRWTFKQNSNGSWSILSMADPTLCVNLWTGYPTLNGAIKLYSYENSGNARAWTLDQLAPSVKTNLHYVEDLTKLYTTQTKISNARENHAKILSMPSSGWSVKYSDSGNPLQLNAANYLSSPAEFSFMYEDCLDINGKAADIQVDLTVLSQSLNHDQRVMVQLGFAWKGILTGDLFDGIDMNRTNKWTVKYTAYDHETGGQISLKGAWLNIFSLSGAHCGDPSNGCNYMKKYGTDSITPHEGAVYLQKTGTAEAYIMKNNDLCNFCDGVYFGRGHMDDEIDNVGIAGSETQSVAFVCMDDAPTFQHFVMDYAIDGSHMNAWFFPMFCPLGIIDPGAPTKSAKITS